MVWQFLRKFHIDLPHDPVIPIQAILSKKKKNERLDLISKALGSANEVSLKGDILCDSMHMTLQKRKKIQGQRTDQRPPGVGGRGGLAAKG